MPLSRRVLLGAAAVALTGCAASPVITGTPAAAPSPTLPTQSAEAAEAAAAVSRLAATLGGLTSLAAWTEQPWATAAAAQAAAHLARLTVPEPLAEPEGQDPFETPAVAEAPPADLAAAEAQLASAIEDAAQALEGAAGTADDPELRLLYASAGAATSGLRNRSVAPVASDSQPRPLQDTTLAASLPIALGHAWALIYGLGVGLGRLGRDDPLREAGTSRLTGARELRNSLRDALGDDAPVQPAAFELPTTMDSPETIRAGWAELELSLLDALGRLVAADPGQEWRARFSEQASAPHIFGGAVNFWPGWVA